ncbi:hypothetical protein F7Q99_38245 [Streptomyces kaniharaensis]|uniref:DUF2637 domain-containing protein n=1 Tax=Streptomyces kaniharaensis TaxID=212423 RepID=A0A6N7L1L7_9ACTN|nr:hypothetical protein [Streptomyces kaniharaensis]MQS17876.1 hypothetical protein [Streptomyces kaniharaensis]
MTVTPEVPPRPAYDPAVPEHTEPADLAKHHPGYDGDGLAELAQELRQSRLDAAIPLKADDAGHLIDWARVKRAASAIRRAAQAWPNLAAAAVAAVGPAWLWRGVVEDCSHSFRPAADVADPGLGLGLMTLVGVLVLRSRLRGVVLRTALRMTAWAVVFGTLAYGPARAWAGALLGSVFTGALR